MRSSIEPTSLHTPRVNMGLVFLTIRTKYVCGYRKLVINRIRKSAMGLERWLSAEECIFLFQRIKFSS